MLGESGAAATLAPMVDVTLADVFTHLDTAEVVELSKEAMDYTTRPVPIYDLERRRTSRQEKPAISPDGYFVR